MRRRISVIFNPEAGTGRFHISGEDLVRTIKQAGAVLNKDLEVTLHQTKGKGDASIIASEAVLEGAHDIDECSQLAETENGHRACPIGKYGEVDHRQYTCEPRAAAECDHADNMVVGQ